MSVSKHWLMGGWNPGGLIVHQQRYWPSDSNKNVDIKYINHISRASVLQLLREGISYRPNVQCLMMKPWYAIL
jgi:hypothetical protein